MIVFIFGTTAEALKLSPIWRRMTASGIAFEKWNSGQHIEEIEEGLLAINESFPDRTLVNGFRGKNMTSRNQAFLWAPRVLFSAVVAIKKTRLPGTKTVVLVHGDTLTTLLGALAAKLTRSTCVHVEAGLRSGDWRNPFPEELVRIMVARIADFHFAPSSREVSNLKKESRVTGEIKNTYNNTAVDNLFDFSVQTNRQSGSERYCLVTIHRSESVDDSLFMEQLVETLNQISEGLSVLLVQDHRLKNALKSCQVKLASGVKPMEKKSFPEFISLVSGAEFLITDSGGLQEEAAMLGIPTIVHRKATERYDGLGENIVLSDGQPDKLIAFSKNYQEFVKPMKSLDESPSDLIIDQMNSWNLIRSGD
jgi:UDP-N-acetylglucosamine 2-epimerase (non-hydrolysing)